MGVLLEAVLLEDADFDLVLVVVFLDDDGMPAGGAAPTLPTPSSLVGLGDDPLPPARVAIAGPGCEDKHQLRNEGKQNLNATHHLELVA